MDKKQLSQYRKMAEKKQAEAEVSALTKALHTTLDELEKVMAENETYKKMLQTRADYAGEATENISSEISVNLSALRRLYNLDQMGRGKPGLYTRRDLHVTITNSTFNTFSELVPVKQAGYGSSVVELTLRTFLATLGRLPLASIGEELSRVVIEGRPTFVANIRELANFLES